MSNRENNHLSLLCDIGDISNLVSDPSDIDLFLSKTVALVAKHLAAEVCSIYLFEEKSDELVLKATRGLNPSAVNVIRLKSGEGLVGHAFRELAVICDGNVKKNPRFKYFEEADEDAYQSLLAVPIKRGVERIGVLVVQKKELDGFHTFDVQAISGVASQLAGALENIRLLMELRQSDEELPSPPSSLLTFVKGTPASEGCAFAPITVLRKNRNRLMLTKETPGHPLTKADFSRAIERTTKQLRALQEGFRERLPESASLIFTAHFMMLKDPSFSGEMIDMIDAGAHPVEAVKTVAGRYIDLFSDSSHAYMREKALDVEDLALRILSNLLVEDEEDISIEKRIVIATELFPSDILKLASGDVLGIVLVGGGVASHVAILSRSLRIPLVIADEPELMKLPDKTPVIVDADIGNIYIRPDVDTVALYESQRDARKSAGALADWMSDSTMTSDGEKITLLSNINLLSEVTLANRLKAEGIGLYRTEFPFLIRTTFPSEAEQYVIYKNLFDSMEGKTVTIRTLDAGGDKTLAYSDSPAEENPELGLRSIRFSLKHRDVFESQVRAVLRAAVGNDNARIMFPLISSVDELLESKSVVSQCMAALDAEGVEHNPRIQIGMMIELPSILSTVDAFAEEADFFSIGTNDFIQYMLAADRTNKMVSDYYLPHHPAVLRGLHQIAAAGAAAGIDVSVCGEMAHEPRYLPFLLGIGIRTLSINPKFLPEVQSLIKTISLADARTHAEGLLKATTVSSAFKEIEGYHAQAR